MMYNHEIALSIQAEYNSEMPSCKIKHFCFDTRQPVPSPAETLFIALHGVNYNARTFYWQSL